MVWSTVEWHHTRDVLQDGQVHVMMGTGADADRVGYMKTVRPAGQPGYNVSSTYANIPV